MRRRGLVTRSLTGILSAAMVISSTPMVSIAETGEQSTEQVSETDAGDVGGAEGGDAGSTDANGGGAAGTENDTGADGAERGAGGADAIGGAGNTSDADGADDAGDAGSTDDADGTDDADDADGTGSTDNADGTGSIDNADGTGDADGADDTGDADGADDTGDADGTGDADSTGDVDGADSAGGSGHAGGTGSAGEADDAEGTDEDTEGEEADAVDGDLIGEELPTGLEAAIPMTVDLDEGEEVYLLMNIPYSEFYEADIEHNDVEVDAVSSATKAKPLNSGLAGGSYHAKEDGSEITGVTFPVKLGADVTLEDLAEYEQADDADSLFGNETYAYYVLGEEEIPDYYKELTMDGGSLSFGETVGDATTVSADVTITTDTQFGDYQLSVDAISADTVYGVIIHTDEHDYGLRHLENIWRVNELAFSTGFTLVSGHGNSPLKPDHYKSIMGETITSITYYTDDGIYEIELDEGLYVPEKFDGSVTVGDIAVDADELTVACKGFPESYEKQYELDEETVEVDENGVLDLTSLSLTVGTHTLTVSDGTGQYAPVSAKFTVTTDAVPAEYNENLAAPGLQAAEDAADGAFENYISGITSVSVNGTSYAPSGRRGVVIIQPDGSLKTDAAPFAEGTSFAIVVKSAGYPDLSFTYNKEETSDVYVWMNIPYNEFYTAELSNDTAVDGVTSATYQKTRTGSLVGGSYHVGEDGTSIDGVTFPVKLGDGVTLADLAALGYKQVTDADSVTITTSGRGGVSTVTYTGKDALFENPSYAYYVLGGEIPDYYKELTIKDSKPSFGETVGTAKTVEAEVTLTTETDFGDYQLSVEGIDADQAYAVVLHTDDHDYGLRHLENIWRVNELAFSTGFTTVSGHGGSPLKGDHYKSIMGETIRSITYYTDGGIYEIEQVNLLVPVKFDGELTAADADTADGKTTITVTGLPQDFAAEYQLDGEPAEVTDGVLNLAKVKAGVHTMTVTDANGVYAPMSTEFVLNTDDMPAAYDKAALALTAAEGFAAEDLQAFLENIETVSVNGTPYAASGRNAVEIVKADGSLNTDAAPFAEGESFTVVVTAAGYPELTFTYTVGGTTAPGNDGNTDGNGGNTGGNNGNTGGNNGNTDGNGSNTGSNSSNTGSGSGSDGGGSSSGSSSTGSETGKWVLQTSEDGGTYWIYQSNRTGGRMYAGGWASLSNPYAVAGQPGSGWFHFDANGVMDTGWFTDADGSRYYLHPISDGMQGLMLTGWQNIGGAWYYFSQESGSHYGAMLADTLSPDGYRLTADGSWDGQDPAK